MVGRVTRAVIFAGLTLALWVLARPAHAMPAGLCDDRGATAVAPPPAFEPPENALERARTAMSCGDGDGAPMLPTASPGHRVRAPIETGDWALPTGRVAITCATGDVLLRAPEVPSPGTLVRFRVERPPRA